MPPLPKTDAVRRNARKPNRFVLPAGGRPGPPPEPPPGLVLDEHAAAIWADLWGQPQAAAWEMLGTHRAVARYCQLSAANNREPSLRAAGELRLLEKDLGLSPAGLRALEWSIDNEPRQSERDDPDEVTRRRERRRARQARGVKAVDPTMVTPAG